MMNSIEKLLEIKSKESGCEVLFTQWMLAKDYVPKVQSTIIRSFPHYSLHDRTHSETILNCIVRILGPDALQGLSSVDLWLLLAASYYHDLGMAVYAEDVVESFKNEDFLYFVKECQDDESSSLHPFASLFEVQDNRLYFRNVALDGASYDAPRFLLAEFLRRRHAKRSSDQLADDFSIHLAGDPIPERIILLLGRICESHTQSFDEVMQLPFCETGLGLDDCHPRFVACMLRIGDLLDLDNNRFSTVLLRTLPAIPRDSLLHVGKHLSIEHLRIDSSKIEVSARTNDYDVADITNRWLEMIGDEFRRQRELWNDIVPQGFPGRLPIIGELKVDLIGYDTIDGKKRPSFEIDTSKATEMLQGAGLYTRPAQCLRELLQNSVDATYLAIYKEKGKLSLEDFQNACRQKQIKVSIDRGEVFGDRVTWRVVIEDYGLGMSKSDIYFLTKMGSKNPERKRIIESMPEHMRPSGTFGIGFQSVFLLTDKVELFTRKIDSGVEVAVELYNPAGSRKGAVLLKTRPATMHPGTRIQFEFYSDKNLDYWQVSSSEVYASFAVYSFDFLVDKTLDLDTARVLDEISWFSRASLINLEVSLNGEKCEMPVYDGNPFDYYSETQGIQVSITGTDSMVDLYYRNQLVSKANVRIPYLTVQANVMGGNAKDLLSLNRNELQYNAKANIRQKIIETILEAFKHAPSIIPDGAEPCASMFVHKYAVDRLHDYPSLKDKWKDCQYRHFNGSTWHDFGHTFGEIIDKAKGKPVIWIVADRNLGCSENEGALILRVSSHDVFDHLLLQLLETHPYLCNGTDKYGQEGGILLHYQEIDPIDDYKKWMKGYSQRDIYARSMMPCNKEFKVLQIAPSAHFRFATDHTFPVGNHPQMICPYARRMEAGGWRPRVTRIEWDDSDGELYQLVFDNRADKTVTLEDIRKAYERFRAKLDPIVKGINDKL